MGLAMKRERKKDIDKKIKQFKVKSEISNYLNLHNLYFETDEIEGISYITMVFKNCDRCPGHITEGRSLSSKVCTFFDFLWWPINRPPFLRDG